MVEGHLGQLSIAVLAMRAGGEEGYEDALWEARRLGEEILVMLEEIDAVA